VIVNNTSYAVAEAVLIDAEGREVFVVAAKASFGWRPDGSLQPLPEQIPVAVTDKFGEPPATSGLITASEMTLPKPRVDVLLQGEIVLAAPVEQIDCTVEVGNQLFKTLRVFGDRYWRASAIRSVVPSKPKPFAKMPIAWERSFGGTDKTDPATLDRRNPVGRGISKRSSTLEGHPVPNFEDPRAPISDPLKRPVPVGFGPVAPHWQPRSDFAGTYDKAWEENRFPLLPVNFDPRYLNAAPADQQLDRYQPGIEVRLTDFTPGRRARFVLPEVAAPVTVVESGTIHEVKPTVDTIVIDPSAARVSIVARAVYVPNNVQEIATAYVGPLTGGQRRALATGKAYLRLRG
jgi:hypothetical protein